MTALGMPFCRINAVSARVSTPASPMKTPARRRPFIFSSTVRKCAAITVESGVVALRMAARPEPIWVWPDTIRQKGTTLFVRGTTSDNGTVVGVKVGGKQAKALRPNFAEWEAVLTNVAPGPLQLAAYAEDAAGNIEQLPHRLIVDVKKG